MSNTSQDLENMQDVKAATKESNPMGKIALIVGAAIFIFLAFSTFSVQKALHSNSQLSDIRDLYFPVLERVDANIVRLDKMEERFTQGVMMADKDTVDQAQKFYLEGYNVFGEILSRYPARKDDITKLRNEFQAYRELAFQTSMGMIARTGNFSDVARMNNALVVLRQHLKDFRSSSYNNFVLSLKDTQSSTKLNLYMGMAIGVMNLGFMGVLVFFIRNNVRMTAIIAEQNATLELKVVERTAQLSQKTNDINAMLNNMSLGVCTVVQGNKLHPEYSAYMNSIFGRKEFAGQDVLAALFSSSNLGADTRDQVAVALSAIIGEDLMMFDFNSHLLVGEMQVKGEDGSNKILQMHWSPIKNDDNAVDKVLLIVQDVTHLRALEMEAAHQKAELDIISQIIKISIGKFNEFIDSAHKFSAENRQLIQGAKGRDADVINSLFRNMHTIKGNARTYEFKCITDVAHEAEQEYDRLRKDPEAQWDADKMLKELAAVDMAIARYVEVNEDKLGRKGRASDQLTTRGVFVGSDEIHALQTMVANLIKVNAAGDVAEIQKKVNHLGLVPLQRLITGSIDSLSSLAKELNKPEPKVEIVNGDVAVNNLMAQALKSSFMHIVRNSLDHGIESPAERRQAEKADAGNIRFVCEKTADGMILRISDDGRGLALHKLYEKGIASGSFSRETPPTPEQIAEEIFKSGVSTADQVTQISGRGVGMDAVRMFLKEQNADVRIVLLGSGETLGFRPFEFVINLPSAAMLAA